MGGRERRNKLPLPRTKQRCPHLLASFGNKTERNSVDVDCSQIIGQVTNHLRLPASPSLVRRDRPSCPREGRPSSMKSNKTPPSRQLPLKSSGHTSEALGFFRFLLVSASRQSKPRPSSSGPEVFCHQVSRWPSGWCATTRGSPTETGRLRNPAPRHM